MASTRNIHETIYKSMVGYASLITKLAKQYSESSRIRRTIHSTVEVEGEKFIVRTFAGDGSTGEGGTGDARAREYGSGLWSTTKAPKKYPIRPTKGKALVFPWDTPTSVFSGPTVSEKLPRTDDGDVILPMVMHPGIQADNSGKGYIRPARVEASKYLRKRLIEDGVNGIRLDIKSAFVGAKTR